MDRLTVLVFKDNHVARTFRVPLRWIAQFSWVLIFFFALSVGAVTFGVVNYLHRLNPLTLSRGQDGRASDLEKKLHDLQIAYQELEAKKMTAAEPEASPGPIVTEEPTAGTLTDLSLKLPLFKALPDSIQAAADPSTLPIEIANPRVRWEGKSLKIHFNLIYKNPGHGSQQGRIILIARGPSMMMIYPKKAFYSADHETLIDPNQGETFSVGRFREVHASFGPVDSRELTEVEAILIGQNGQLLFHRRFAPGQSAPAPKAAPKAVSAPEQDSADDTKDDAGQDSPAAAVAAPAAPAAPAAQPSPGVHP